MIRPQWEWAFDDADGVALDRPSAPCSPTSSTPSSGSARAGASWPSRASQSRACCTTAAAGRARPRVPLARRPERSPVRRPARLAASSTGADDVAGTPSASHAAARPGTPRSSTVHGLGERAAAAVSLEAAVDAERPARARRRTPRAGAAEREDRRRRGAQVGPAATARPRGTGDVPRRAAAARGGRTSRSRRSRSIDAAGAARPRARRAEQLGGDELLEHRASRCRRAGARPRGARRGRGCAADPADAEPAPERLRRRPQRDDGAGRRARRRRTARAARRRRSSSVSVSSPITVRPVPAGDRPDALAGPRATARPVGLWWSGTR